MRFLRVLAVLSLAVISVYTMLRRGYSLHESLWNMVGANLVCLWHRCLRRCYVAFRHLESSSGCMRMATSLLQLREAERRVEIRWEGESDK